VRELVRWDENFYDGRVGGLDVVRQLETPGRLNDGTTLTYAWGLTVGSYRGLPMVEHSGSLGGYRAHLIRFRAEHFSVATLCNLSSVNTGTLVRRVADAYLGERLTRPVPPPAPGAGAQAQQAPGQTYTPGDLAAFAGRYDSGELETYRLSLDGERLTLRRGVQRQLLTLQAGPKDEFSVPDSTLRFRRDTNGAVTGLVVDAGRTRGVVFEKKAAGVR
jgi:hypothetical protein